MRTKRVIVEDYNPKWKNEFERILNELLEVLSGKIISIEHVGSTSVEGLLAKPIIDIDIVIAQNFDEVRQVLEAMRRHVMFRDYLRQHKEKREKYGEIKKEMALKYPESIDSYIEGKQTIIMEIYKKCGLS